MSDHGNPLDKFEFLLGDWKLEYRVPKSALGGPDTGTGEGTFKRGLDGRYVFFDYRAVLAVGGDMSAHALFAWDEKAKIYRYWWFESSGSFLTASCDFVADGVLRMNWHDTLLVQTFSKEGPDHVLLSMEHPAAGGGYEVLLEVDLKRK